MKCSGGIGRAALLAGGLAVALTLAGCSDLLERAARVPSEVRAAAELLKRDDADAAAAKLDGFIAKKTDDPARYLAAAQLFASARKPAMAARYAEEGLRATPGARDIVHAEMYGVLGVARQTLGDFAAAVEAHRNALRLAPREPNAMNNLAYAYAEMPDGGPFLQEAERLASESVRLAREADAPPAILGVYLDTLGWVQFKMGKPALASLHLGMALEAAPDQPDILYHLARSYQANGRLANARTLLERALKTMPDHAQARLALDEIGVLDRHDGRPAP